ncbi:MAG: tetratricopeptide repeat protein, partial [Thermoanaerobaculia bacterium]
QEAFRLSNGSPLHAKPLALLCLELGNLDDAISYLRLAIENEPEEIPLRLMESSALLRLRRLPEALKAAERTVELAPYNADAVYQRGVVKMGSGLLKEAEVDLRRALELAPNHTAAMSDLAVLLTSTGETGEARRLLERVLELRPEDAVAAENLGRLNRAPSR